MISSIRLQNFRSYNDESFEFDNGVNIIVGPNASGKTNLLEAVLVLSVGKSYRARDVELIKNQKPWARAEAFLNDQKRILKLKKTNLGTEKEIAFSGRSSKRLSFNQTFPVIFFEPSDLIAINRGPDSRRQLIDNLLEKSQPDYKSLTNKYKRTLVQRNALLKRGFSSSNSQFFAWNLSLAESGEKIAVARAALIDKINQKIGKYYSLVAKKSSPARLDYKAQFPLENYASKMFNKLESSADQDYQRGFTAYGPHREDIQFFLNNKDLNQTASRGEVRSLVLAMKMYELDLVEGARQQKPILLLDDVFSELDGSRRSALVEALKDHQTIITTTDADSVVEHFASGRHKLISLSK